jgi:hypothetical protein
MSAHSHYCALSHNGWATQVASRKPWTDVPEANKATMRRSMAAVLDLLESEGRLQDPAP